MQIYKRLKSPFKVASKGRSDAIGVGEVYSQVLHEVNHDAAKINLPKIASPVQHEDLPYKLPGSTEMVLQYDKLKAALEV